VTQASCATCHRTYSAGDTTPPTTSSSAQTSYVGAAVIRFTVTDGGKVGVGTTYYRVDGGTIRVGSQAVVSDAGPHAIEFWSVDQAGNVEAPPKRADFTVVEDTTPPTTTSNAVSYYEQGATIRLTANDASSQGVMATYYTVNGGPTQTGTTVNIPATPGTVAYTLRFWSEDWSSNVEATKTANFTVLSGTGTIRLDWGAPSVPEDWVEWTVRRGGSTGQIVATGGSYHPWDGVDDIVVPVSATPYWLKIAWGDASEPYDEFWIPSVLVDTPGQIVTP
jgi:hypothetical protein